jgi:hypothetical protein
MELRAVRRAVTLARMLSYPKAARELNVTQSGLARSIQQFEDRAGVWLFDRDCGASAYHHPSSFHQQHYCQCCAIIMNVVHDTHKGLPRPGSRDAAILVVTAPLDDPVSLLSKTRIGITDIPGSVLARQPCAPQSVVRN